MISRLIRKIGEIFFRRREDKDTIVEELCPYKIEADNYIRATLTCSYCKEDLVGRESAEDTGVKYICCSSCCYVNKIYKGEVVEKEETEEEILRAYKLFSLSGQRVSTYAKEINTERKDISELLNK